MEHGRFVHFTLLLRYNCGLRLDGSRSFVLRVKVPARCLSREGQERAPSLIQHLPSNQALFNLSGAHASSPKVKLDACAPDSLDKKLRNLAGCMQELVTLFLTCFAGF